MRSDPIFAAIHNAFLVGWNLLELKSRLLNCLSLLYIQPSDALDVMTITNYQGQIQTIILEQQPFPLKKDLNAAIKRFTGVTVRFLEAWDSFLRERYYVGRDFENFETEMIAYEAGRSMTSLSWGYRLENCPLRKCIGEKSRRYFRSATTLYGLEERLQ